MKVQIVTDSMTDIPLAMAETYGIEVVPLTIYFGDEEYQDGITLSTAEFYEKLKGAKGLPRTAQVTPYAFEQVFRKHLAAGRSVLCINASSSASGTHQSALMAKQGLEGEPVEVFDTMALCFGAGLFVYQAAQMAQRGCEMEEIIAHLQTLVGKIDHVFTVHTMEYLKKGGRLNPMKAVIGELLHVKPILTVKDGLVEPLDKIRGNKRVFGKMIELAKERGGSFRNKTVTIAHAADLEKALLLKERVEEELQPRELLMVEIGCTIGSHAGPGTLALFYKNQEIE